MLALTYGSLVAAGMNLLTAVVGVGVGVLGITIATGFVDLQSTTPILAAMLGLAVGIDYALFIITRYRQELRGGADVADRRSRTAVGTAGSAVVTAGLTVVIALAGLSVVGIPFLTQMGLAAAATIVVAVLVAITLVPGGARLPRPARRCPGSSGAAGRGRPAATTGRRARLPGRAGSARSPGTGCWRCCSPWSRSGVVAIPFVSMQTTLVQTPADGHHPGPGRAAARRRLRPGLQRPADRPVDGRRRRRAGRPGRADRSPGSTTSRS